MLEGGGMCIMYGGNSVQWGFVSTNLLNLLAMSLHRIPECVQIFWYVRGMCILIVFGVLLV